MSDKGDTKKTIKTKYVGFCRAHSFSPLSVTVVLVSIFFLLSGGVFWGLRTTSVVESRTTELGLKNIGELATQAAFYRNVQVISNNREVFGVNVPFTQSSYIYSYDGAIKVGYNFETIDVAVDDTSKTVTIQLPEPIVISNDIDEDSLKVYNESKNIFTPLKLDQVNSSQSAMKEEALETAINNGLFENARANAELLISGFLSGSINLQEYAIVFESEYIDGEKSQ